MCFDTWMQCVQANLSTSCSPVFKRQLVNLNITCFSLYLCVCRWFPALNGTLSTVSMRMVVSLSECVAPLPLRKKQQVWKLSKEIYTHACRHMLIVLYLETTLAPSHHPFSQTALQSACSLSLCSNGHLACYSLIYLWLSVIGQLYDWISLSYCCLLSLHAISLSPAVCFCEPLTYSLSFIHWFYSYLCKSFIVSLFSALQLFCHTQKLSPAVSQSHFLHLLSTTVSVYFVCLLDHQLLNVLPHMFYFLFLPVCHPFLSIVPQFAPIPSNFSPTIFLSFLLPHVFSNVLCPPFFTTLISFYMSTFLLHPLLSLSDPEQSVHELVYDLRSQCDAIRVTKTVRPYRMVVCPVNENNAALMVSDGRAMLWELKAHTAKAAANPRYTYTHTHKLQEEVIDKGLNTGNLKWLQTT